MENSNFAKTNIFYQQPLTANNLPYINQLLEFYNNFSVEATQSELEQTQSITNSSQSDIDFNQSIFNLQGDKLFNQELSTTPFETIKSMFDESKFNYYQNELNTNHSWNNFDTTQNNVTNDNTLMFNSNLFVNNTFTLNSLNFPQFLFSNNLNKNNCNTFLSNDVTKLQTNELQPENTLVKSHESNFLPNFYVQKNFAFELENPNLMHIENVHSLPANTENFFDNNLYEQQNMNFFQTQNTNNFSFKHLNKNIEEKNNQNNFLMEPNNYIALKSDVGSSNTNMDYIKQKRLINLDKNEKTIKSAKILNASSAHSKNIYCKVTSRLSVLNNTKKYNVTVGEIFRRTTVPECLNASILAGILRKAKKKESGKSLRSTVEQFGIDLPLGRRKSSPITVFTALCEEEAIQICNDFSTITEQIFPISELADNLFDSNASYYCKYNAYFLQLLTEIIELLNLTQLHIQYAEKEDFDGKIPDITKTDVEDENLSKEILNSLLYMSRLTHSFGNRAIGITLDVLSKVLNNFKKNFENLVINLETVSLIIPSEEMTNELI